MAEQGAWDVFVDDNFHYMDEDERYHLGRYPTYEAAEDACRRLVDRCLNGLLQPGMTAEQLWEQYRSFGEDPFVRGPDLPEPPFSAWGYARQRCRELTGEARGPG